MAPVCLLKLQTEWLEMADNDLAKRLEQLKKGPGGKAPAPVQSEDALWVRLRQLKGNSQNFHFPT